MSLESRIGRYRRKNRIKAVGGLLSALSLYLAPVFGIGGCSGRRPSVLDTPESVYAKWNAQTINNDEDTLSAFDVGTDNLTYALTQTTANGTLTFDTNTGLVNYMPNPDFFGTDTFKFTATDGTTTTESTITFNVLNANDAPTLSYNIVRGVPSGVNSVDNIENEIIHVEVSANDVDGDPVTITSSGLPSGAIFDDRDLDGDMDFVWRPDLSQGDLDPSSYTINFTADDGKGGVTTDTFNFGVFDKINPTKILLSYEDGTVSGGVGHGKLGIMNEDGSGLVTLLNKDAWDPRFYPGDNSRLTYSRENSDDRHYIAKTSDVLGTKKVIYDSTPDSPYRFSISPDRTKCAWLQKVSFNSVGIFIADWDDATETLLNPSQLTGNLNGGGGPHFVSEGGVEWVYYHADKGDGQYDIYRFRRDKTGVEEFVLGDATADDFIAGVSNDGKYISVSSDREQANLWNLYVAKTDGSSLVKVFQSYPGVGERVGSNTGAAFSPDDSKIVLDQSELDISAGGYTKADLYIIDVLRDINGNIIGGAYPTRITNGSDLYYSPDW